MDSASFVKGYVSRSKKPLVVDADALKVISLDMLDKAILTPHRGEMGLLLKNSRLHFEKLQMLL